MRRSRLGCAAAAAFLLCSVAAASPSPSAAASEGETCSDVTVPMCLDLPYNQTTYPNLLRHLGQEEAGPELYTYFPLLKANCSDDIRLFLCAVYVPVCNPLRRPLPPCRDLCRSARRCQDIMAKFGYAWPESFRCERFPDGEEEPCVRSPPAPGPRKATPRCPASLAADPELGFRVDLGDGGPLADCGLPCRGFLVEGGGEDAVGRYLGFAAGLNGLLTAAAVSTFAVDTTRYPHPERTLVYLLASSFCLSALFLVGQGAGDGLACRAPPLGADGTDPGRSSLLRQGSDALACAASGMLFSFFLAASGLWWLATAFAWFLSAGLGWADEGIRSKMPRLHGLVWTSAALQTSAVYIFNLPEGDATAGLCVVGVANASGLLAAAAPLLLSVSLGAACFLLGALRWRPLRRGMRAAGTDTRDADKFAVKMGLLHLAYVLPSAVTLSCYFYAYFRAPRWAEAWDRDACKDPLYEPGFYGTCDAQADPPPGRPGPSFYVVKHVSLLMTGTLTSLYVLAARPLASWREVFQKVRASCARRDPPKLGDVGPHFQMHTGPFYPELSRLAK